eukprot:654202_1
MQCQRCEGSNGSAIILSSGIRRTSFTNPMDALLAEQRIVFGLLKRCFVSNWCQRGSHSHATGGCWIIKIAKREPFLDGLWEDLLMSTIGENFLLSIRREVCNITVWNRDNRRLKEILNLDEESTLYLYDCQ